MRSVATFRFPWVADTGSRARPLGTTEGRWLKNRVAADIRPLPTRRDRVPTRFGDPFDDAGLPGNEVLIARLVKVAFTRSNSAMAA